MAVLEQRRLICGALACAVCGDRAPAPTLRHDEDGLSSSVGHVYGAFASKAVAPRGTPLVGTDGRDRLIGSEASETIRCLAGADNAAAGAGDDVVLADVGDDHVFGEQGSDLLVGAAGSDRLVGGEGADLIFGGPGVDYLWGHNGGDVLLGGDSADRVVGGAGGDVLCGGGGDDMISAGAGDDIVFGGDERDMINPGPGNDVVFAGAGDDLVRVYDWCEAEGSKLLVGGPGIDELVLPEPLDDLRRKGLIVVVSFERITVLPVVKRAVCERKGFVAAELVGKITRFDDRGAPEFTVEQGTAAGAKIEEGTIVRISSTDSLSPSSLPISLEVGFRYRLFLMIAPGSPPLSAMFDFDPVDSFIEALPNTRLGATGSIPLPERRGEGLPPRRDR